MNNLGDPASSRVAALWARFARIVHLALKLRVSGKFSGET
jgi:hypothetical protein